MYDDCSFSPRLLFLISFYYYTTTQDTERPLNDSCDTAFEIPSATLPFSLSADTSGAFTDFSSPTCSVDSDARGIWYRFTPTVDRIVTLQIDASDRFRGRIVLFRGACALQGCFDGTIASSSSQQLRWRGVAGEEYTVLVTGNGAGFRDVGPFSLELNVSVSPSWILWLLLEAEKKRINLTLSCMQQLCFFLVGY